jgi:hypothetical protein
MLCVEKLKIKDANVTCDHPYHYMIIVFAKEHNGSLERRCRGRFVVVVFVVAVARLRRLVVVKRTHEKSCTLIGAQNI